MLRYLLAIFLVLIPQICFARKSRTLDLIGKGISDVSNIGIPNRIRNLLLGDNNISSLEGLMLPPKIKTISLRENQLVNLNGLFSDSLLSLTLDDNPTLRDLSGLGNLSKLKTLFLSGNFLDESNFDMDSIPSGIEELSLISNAFKEIDLRKFISLKIVRINEMFSSLNGFSEDLLDYSKVLLPEGLESIRIGSNDYPEDFTDLVLPNSVTEIDLSFSFITTDELKTLKFPPNLRKLRIKRNSIETLDGIEFPKSLRVLNLQIGPMTKEERQKARAKLGKRVRIIFKCGKKCQFRP